LTLSLPSSEVIDMIKDGQAKAAQRRAPRASPPAANSTN
jgi:hypothetical protein